MKKQKPSIRISIANKEHKISKKLSYLSFTADALFPSPTPEKR